MKAKQKQSELEEEYDPNAVVMDLLSNGAESQHAAKDHVVVIESSVKPHQATNIRAAMGRSPSKGLAQEGSSQMP